MIQVLRAAGVAAVLVFPGLAAAELTAPSGPVILSVTGNLVETNAGDAAEFDLEMLDSLPQHTTVAETPWYDEVKSFSGPLISALLEKVEAEGKTLRVIALNDYSAEIPLSDIRDHPVILATRVDGTTMSVRDKGPMFVIYPFDAKPELYNEEIFGRSVWQVNRIEIE